MLHFYSLVLHATVRSSDVSEKQVSTDTKSRLEMRLVTRTAYHHMFPKVVKVTENTM